MKYFYFVINAKQVWADGSETYFADVMKIAPSLNISRYVETYHDIHSCSEYTNDIISLSICETHKQAFEMVRLHNRGLRENKQYFADKI